jgi:uncharacterized protein
MDESPQNIAIRFYNGSLDLTRLTTPAGKSFFLLSLPYSLASQTKKYISWLKGRVAVFPDHIEDFLPEN